MENTSLQITDEKLSEYLNLYGFSNIPELEKKQFIEICRMNGLNPFKREAHISAYGEGKYRVFAVITGYEVYIRRAEESGRLEGWEAPVITQCKTAKINRKGEISIIDDIEATITIYRSDFKYPFKHSVKLSEYIQKTKEGDVTKFWLNCESQLKKVAISQGFRLCFNEILSTLPFTSEEYDHQKTIRIHPSNNIQIEESTTLTTPENIAKKETLLPETEKWNAALDYISESENTDTAFQKIEKKYEISADDKVRLLAEAVDLFSYKIEQAKNGNGDEYTD